MLIVFQRTRCSDAARKSNALHDQHMSVNAAVDAMALGSVKARKIRQDPC